MGHEFIKSSHYFVVTPPRNKLSGKKFFKINNWFLFNYSESENLTFSRTLPASKKDESASLAELLKNQALALGKSKSQPTLLETIQKSKFDFSKRARDKLSVELELMLQKKQILVDLMRLKSSTNKRYLEQSEFVTILKNYGIYSILAAKLSQIISVLRESNGTIEWVSTFISLFRKQ